MSVRLDYTVWLQKSNNKSVYPLSITTTQIAVISGGKLPPDVDNESRVGEMFGAIKAHGTVSVVIPAIQVASKAAVHDLLALPQHQSIFDLSIYLKRHTTSADNSDPSHPNEITRTPAKILLLKVEIANVRDMKDGSFVVDFKASSTDDKSIIIAYPSEIE